MAQKKPTPDADLENVKTFNFNGKTFKAKTKFAVGRFLKTLNESPIDAIELVLLPDSYEEFLDTEMTIDKELPEFMEAMSNAISGGNLGN